MEGCEIAYHVAAINTHCPPDPDLLLRTNVQGAENAVRAAARAGIRRVVFTSSAASVGEPKGTIGREDTEHRGSYLSVYDKSKHHGEQAAFGEGARLGVDVVAVNPSSVQGPGRASGNGKLIIDYVNGKLPVFVDTHVSIADIRDVVEAHVLAAERGADGERYVINGATIHTDDVVEIVREVAGLSHRVRMVPPAVARAAALAAEGAARVRGKKTSSFCPARVRTILHGHQYDGSRAERELGLSYTPVHETFSRTLEWAASEGLLDT
jgi:dihydroflavonol-4-reductase